MKSYRMGIAVAVVAMIGLAASAQAGMTYQIGSGSSITATSADPGLIMETQLSSSLAGRTFDLNDGEHASFRFFKIWTREGWVNEDDEVAKPISATLDFATPTDDAILTGETQGINEIFGLFQYGKITWNGPVVVTAADRVFKVSLNNATFDKGFLELDGGKCQGAWIYACVEQISSNVGNSVPLPSAALSGLTMLGSLGAFRLVRRGRQAA